MTLLSTNMLAGDLPAECWRAAAEIASVGCAFSEEFWNAAARQMLAGLIIHIVTTCPLEKRTLETLLQFVEGGVKAVAEIRANTKSGAVRAWLHPSPAETDDHYTAAILAECAANLHRFLLSKSVETR
jgi:hypothetical protein